MLFLSPDRAYAQTSYTYVSGGSLGITDNPPFNNQFSPSPFNSFGPIILNITLSSPLLPNSTCSNFYSGASQSISVLSWSASEGNIKMSSDSPLGLPGAPPRNGIYLETDSAGRITSWYFYVYNWLIENVIDANLESYNCNVASIVGVNGARMDEANAQYHDFYVGGYDFLIGPVGSWSSSVPIQLASQLGNPTNMSGCPSVGEPINVANGNVYDSTTDYQTAGANRLSFVRYYNSLASQNVGPSILGSHWRSTFDRGIGIESASSVIVTRQDGQVIRFVKTGMSWTTDSDINLSLSQSGSVWILHDRDDTLETYVTSSDGGAAVLTSIRAIGGYTQTLHYSAGQLMSVTDSYGRNLSFTYQNSLLQTLTTPDNLTLTYGYDSSGVFSGTIDRLKSVSYSTSPVTKKIYNYQQSGLPFALTSVTDENGNPFTSWTYDAFGRGLTSQFGAGATLTVLTYNDTDGSRTVVGPLGQKEVYKFTTLQGIPKVTEIDRIATSTTAAAVRKFTYDANGYTASETDWNGNLTTSVNDSLGRSTSIVEASGTSIARTTTISYFQNDLLPTQIVAPNLTTVFTYDPDGNLLTKTETDTTSTSTPYKTAGQTRTWKYTWLNGLLASEQLPRVNVKALTSFTYDGSGALTQTANALGQITRVTQHTPGGLPLTVVDVNGVTTNLSYDARLRLGSRTVNTTAGALTTRYAYDAAGNLLKVTLPDGSALMNGYDTAHRLTRTNDLLKQSIAYRLDLEGNPILANTTDAAAKVQRQHSSSFDALGRLLVDTGGAGQVTTHKYDANGNLLVVTNLPGRSQSQTFDALNRPIVITDPSNGVTTTSYDPAGHPLVITDPNLASTTYVYDGFGEMISSMSRDTNTTGYRYDQDGNVTQKVDASGSVCNLSYDALDRLTAMSYPANPAENVTFQYDQPGHGFGVGRLTTVIDAAGRLSRSYDERGNVVTEARTAPTATLTISFRYDPVSRLAGIVYPSGVNVSYLRDMMGRTTSVTVQKPGDAAVQNVASSINYKPFGPMSSLTFGNGVVESRAFDTDYRLTNIADLGSQTLQSLTYNYDTADNVLSLADAVAPANSQTFRYDLSNRLTDAAGSYGTLSYQYDAVGNRLSQTLGSAVTSYVYLQHTNRLGRIISASVPQNVTLTAAGNISAIGSASGNTMTYNQAGRLAAVTSASQNIAQYAYDAFGNRLIKTTPAGTTLFQYNPQGCMLEEASSAGTANTDYIYLDDGTPIAVVSPSTGVSYLHTDRLGTPQLATNASQATVWNATYQPFGQITPTGSITQNLRFPGQYADAETGWSQNGFRDYAPNLGRYLESDPIGLVGGLNTYGYVNNNPVNSIDPQGTQAIGGAVSRRISEYKGYKNVDSLDKAFRAGYDAGRDPGNAGQIIGKYIGKKLGSSYGRKIGAVEGAEIGLEAGAWIGGKFFGAPGAFYGALGGAALGYLGGYFGGGCLGERAGGLIGGGIGHKLDEWINPFHHEDNNGQSTGVTNYPNSWAGADSFLPGIA
jgi:RHS repeat-associated protein